MPYPLPLTRTEAYLAYKAGVIQQSDLKPSLAVPRNGIDAWLAYWTGLAADYPKREDGTPHILQEEEAYIAYLCGVINEYPEKCLRRVGAYLRYLISARWGRPDHPLNREELYLSLIKTQFIPSGDPSSDIVIDGTAKAPFVDVKMFGDTYQQTYTGKNLVGFPTGSFTRDGLDFTFAEDGTITIDGTRTGTSASFYNRTTLLSLIAGNFRLTIIPISGDYSGSSLGIRGWNGSTQSFYSARSSGGEYGGAVSLTQEQVDTTIAIDMLIGSGTAVFDDFKFKLQVTAGTGRDTDYEPYVGGVPSPNPDYPQPIQTVTGEQTVDIQGKNLANPTPVSGGSNGVFATYNSQTGEVTVSGKAQITWSNLFKVANASYLTAGTYTLKQYGELTNGRIACYARGNGHQVNASTLQTTFTIPSDGNAYICITGLTPGSPVSGTIKFQLESGSTATQFVPYSKQTLPLDLGSIELCKLGTYQDYIWKDGEDWKVHKEIATITVDGSEDWQYSGDNKFSANYINGMAVPVNADVVCYCSTHIGVLSAGNGASFTPLVADKPYATDVHKTLRMVRFKDIRFTTTTELKSWLSQNNTTIYYVVATPTDTTITDQNLISQLEALVNGGAENGTTYIKVKSTDPNLPGLLYVEAPKYE